MVGCLSQELTDHQYQHLVAYFKAKETKGQLTPAKQLLLKHLHRAKACTPAADTRDQQQQTSSSQPVSSKPGSAVVGAIVGVSNTRTNTDQGFYGSSQPDFWDAAAKHQLFLQAQQQQQQLCGITAAAAWSGAGVGGRPYLDLSQ